MKTVHKLLVGLLAAGILTVGAGCIKIADSFLISLVLPAEYCFELGTANEAEWGGEKSVSLRHLIDEIDPQYIDHIKATWVTDILIAVSGPYPAAGAVSGQVEFRIAGTDWTRLLSFEEVPYSGLAEGVSLLNLNPSLVTFDDAGVPALLAALTSVMGLPAFDAIELRASGTTTPLDQPGVAICVKLVLGADAEIEP